MDAKELKIQVPEGYEIDKKTIFYMLILCSFCSFCFFWYVL